MNKLTKVGLSALAGSLAAVSAHAVDYSVTGDAQVVYSSAEGNEADSNTSNGRGIGVDTDLYFTAGGELDNGFTVSVFTAMDMEQSNTATSGGLNSSAQLTIGMGSLGTVQFNDVSGSAANAIDDVLPKAYEEAWDGTSHSSGFHSFGSSTQSGSVDYRLPALSFGDMSISLTATLDPNSGSGPAGAGGVAANDDSGEAFTAKISGMGFTIGAGHETYASGADGTTGSADGERATGYILYSNVPSLKGLGITLPLIFYNVLKLRLKNQNKNILFLISLIIFLSPYFRSSTIWLTNDNLTLIFLCSSIYYFYKSEKFKNNNFYYTFFCLIFLIFAVYIRQNFILFVFFYIYYLLKNSNNKKIIILLLTSLIAVLPIINYLFIYNHIDYYFSNKQVSSANYSLNLLIFLNIILFYLIPFLVSKNISLSSISASKSPRVFLKIPTLVVMIFCSRFFNLPMAAIFSFEIY